MGNTVTLVHIAKVMLSAVFNRQIEFFGFVDLLIVSLMLLMVYICICNLQVYVQCVGSKFLTPSITNKAMYNAERRERRC